MNYNTYLDDYYAKNKIYFTKIDNIDINKFSSFIHAINYWSQLLGLVISKCSDYKKRKNLVKNLYDENNGEYTHVETFYMFLQELGYMGNIDKINMNLYTELYIANIKYIIQNNNFDECCQILGSIEYIYQKISADIISWFRLKYNHYPKNHFMLHETLDITHAQELFELNTHDICENNLIIGAEWIISIIQNLVI